MASNPPTQDLNQSYQSLKSHLQSHQQNLTVASNPRAQAQQPKQSYATLKSHLQSLHAPHTSPLTRPSKASILSPKSSHAIASLSLHPVLESLLHILNNDLPSAHFLLRHMQSPPAYESMLVHGLLHRVEGDYENARAWYTNLADESPQPEIFGKVWPEGMDGSDDGKGYAAFLEGLKKGEREGWVRERGEKEWRDVFGFCEGKFGIGEVVDATGVWVEPSEHIREAAKKQLVGGEGWRQF
ncbi:unnamed protein product [Zymoseptoria tritici ST99CH_1E4]|uniref:Uncharacterized protein n=1 Tax=Zymoseptoria tritici ST99CH_1E4 TaxID=1276532 RepID=A0A2H1GT63_ZYMTR|nr:unnamed protein product [Zymoseptoria tritici ST99CH_1E4]